LLVLVQRILFRLHAALCARTHGRHPTDAALSGCPLAAPDVGGPLGCGLDSRRHWPDGHPTRCQYSDEGEPARSYRRSVELPYARMFYPLATTGVEFWPSATCPDQGCLLGNQATWT